MGSSRTRRSGTVKLPADHLGKVARRESCPIYLDEQHVLDLEDAAGEVDRVSRELEGTRQLRLAAVRDEVRVHHDGDDLPAAIQAAEDRVYAADEARLVELRAERDRLQALVDETTRTYVFRSIGRRKWDELKDACPPGKADHDVWRQQKHEGAPPFSAEALAPRLIQLAAIEPTLTPEDVETMFDGDSWNEAELGMLYTTALAAQAQQRHPRARR